MITPADIERIAKLLAGDAPGWQTRFGAMTGMSRGHVSNLLSGERSVTQAVTIRIIAAARKQSLALRDRADEIDAMLQELPTLGEFATMPRGDKEQGDDE
jgi:hypothetical protein